MKSSFIVPIGTCELKDDIIGKLILLECLALMKKPKNGLDMFEHADIPVKSDKLTNEDQVNISQKSRPMI